MKQLIEQGPDAMAGLFTRMFGFAMQMEGARFLRDGYGARLPERRAFAKRCNPGCADTPAATVTVQTPGNAARAGKPFYPRSIERGRRSVRAVLSAGGGRDVRQRRLDL